MGYVVGVFPYFLDEILMGGLMRLCLVNCMDFWGSVR